MRVTGGQFKGRRPKLVKGFKGRPTTDFGRESLFNLLRSRLDVEGADVLDLFAGTGMVGLEFASRGCATLTAVEQDVRAVRAIQQMFRFFELEHCQVIRGNAMDFIHRALTSYDIVFADPPYGLDGLEMIPARVMESGLLEPDGWLIFEHGERTDVSEVQGFQECRHYGHVHFSLFKK
jgi:16S rRNA (guanine(966)-N(2))-methyltransferase RsmD